MKLDRFATYVWGVLGYNLLVVLWGAYVRATGSGAGCGSHWPLCNDEVVPREAQVATMIEFTHRATSGVALLAVVGVLVWALRSYPRGHRVRLGAGLSMGFMVLEALLGAGLVLFELVADNASSVRAFSMVAHLVNTFLLIGAITITAWWASGGPAVRLRWRTPAGVLLAPAFAAILLVGASGAVAALGNTLFPTTSLAEGIRADFSSTAHFLLRLRVLHPFLAVGTAVYLVVAARALVRLRRRPVTLPLARLLTVLVCVQVAAGFLNLWLLAPVWMQLVHLLLADLVWISLVLLAAAAMAAQDAARPSPSHAAARRTPLPS